MITRLKKILSDKGFIATFALSFFCICFFYGQLLLKPNQTYYSSSGDGLQAYSVAIYHVKYDQSYWHTTGMNYPYGEQVFYTGCQPFITNIIKLVSTVIDVSDYTVGILNLLMLFSIVISALCFYLIFKHYRLHYLYSAIAATAIVFLSPQVIRLNGHLSLAYQFVIPLFILLLIRFYESPTVKKSLWIGLLTFFMAGTHFYFFGFFAILSVFYWSFLFFSRDEKGGKIKFAMKHFFIQLIAPFMLLQGIIYLIETVKDRTAFPWGYLEYTTNLTGMFFPVKRFYTPVFAKYIMPIWPNWEGYGYIGIVAIIVCIGIIWIAFRRLLRGKLKQIFIVTDDKLLNSFFWASIAALILAFGFPFYMETFEGLLIYSGPLKQLRGIGRFLWLFYYVINIIAFYKIYHWAISKKAAIKYSVFSIALLFVCYDAFIMTTVIQAELNNKIEQLNDTENELPENKWINEINVNDYQAMIPLPYFHVGSENVWIIGESDIIKEIFIASVKTGLPMTSVISSRISLSQTYKNIQLVKEPYRKLEILTDLKSEKPFLVLVRESEINESERKLLSKCKKIKESKNYNLYELTVETLSHITEDLYPKAMDEYSKTKLFRMDGHEAADSLTPFVYNGFENKIHNKSYRGKGCFEGKIKEHNIIYKGSIPNSKDLEYTLSFWVDNFKTDIYTRSTVELLYTDLLDKTYDVVYFNMGAQIVTFDGDWGLFEGTFKIRNRSDIVTVQVWNHQIDWKETAFRADELWIQPTGSRIFENIPGESITVNNRMYLKE